MNMLLLTWNSEVGISEVIAGLTFLAVIIGGIFALCQWRVSIKQKRAEYLKELLDKSKSFQNTFLKFEYNKSWYNQPFHDGGDLEEEVDSFFDYLSYICYLRDQKLIEVKDFTFLSYTINRVLQDKQTIDYLHNLYCFSKRIKEEMPFSYLLNYAIENDYISDVEEFKNPQSIEYHRYLNY